MGQKSHTYPRWRLFRVIPVLLLVVVLACDDNDNPVGPGTAEDYPLYFINGNDLATMVYRIHSQKIDSFPSPWAPWKGLQVSPDGSTLYVATRNSEVAVIDVATQSAIDLLPYKASGGLALSADGSLLAVLGTQTWILSTSDYSLVHQDSVPLINAFFSRQRNRLYGIHSSTLTTALVIDLDQQPAQTKRVLFQDHTVHLVRPSLDGNTLFLRGAYSQYASGVIVYDLLHDSAVYRDTIPLEGGDIELSLDGKLLFVSLGSSPFTSTMTARNRLERSLSSPSVGPSCFLVYDVADDMARYAVSTAELDSEAASTVFPVGDLLLTPDGRFLVGTDAWRVSSVFVYDIGRQQFVGYDDETLVDKSAYSFDIQSTPNM